MGFSFSKLFSRLHAEEEVRILMVGLDGAGKTTILCYLGLGEIVTTTPIAGFNVETLEYNNVMLRAWDAGDYDRTRPLWKHYLKNTQGLVFVVDSNDHNRIAEARNELHQMLHEVSKAKVKQILGVEVFPGHLN